MSKIRRRDVETISLTTDYHGDDDSLAHNSDDDEDSVVERPFHHDDDESAAHHGHRLCWCLRVIGMLSILCGMTTYISMRILLRPEDYFIAKNSGSAHNRTSTPDKNLLLEIQCPFFDDADEPPLLLVEEGEEKTYNNIQTLQSSTVLHDWDNYTYEQVQTEKRPWKLSRLAPKLHNGSRIYVSGTGNGVDVYITLDILYQEASISDLMVLGNDLSREAVTSATQILQHAPGSPSSIQICQADSTNLSHVPSNAFDLVYTGHWRPLLDPLDLGPEQRDVRYRELCEALGNYDNSSSSSSSSKDATWSWMASELYHILQQRQTDWLGRWVAEMARIAKPDAPVIVEHMSWHQKGECHSSSVGIIDKEFWNWHATENTYEWNVDPALVVIEDEPMASSSSRYNVHMRKRKE
jgi:hypothetical protein